MKNLGGADLWTTTLKGNYGDTNLHGPAREDDNLMQTLLGLPVESFPLLVTPLPFRRPCNYENLSKRFDASARRKETHPVPPPVPPQTPQVSKGESRLYQLEMPEINGQACVLGVTVGCVRRGDILCKILGTRRNILLRRGTGTDELRVIGTACSPHEGEREQREAAFEGGGDIKIDVDIDMLYALTSPEITELLRHLVWRS